jgi:hypothetical protein
VWGATGINLGIAKDMARRVLMGTISAAGHGDYTTGKVYAIQNPLRWVTKNRAKLLQAMLVLIVDFAKAGRPKPKRHAVLKGFEEWDREVRQCLLHHGYPDPIELQRAAIMTDANAEQNAEFFEALWNVTLGEEFTTSQLIDEVKLKNQLGGCCERLSDARELIPHEHWRRAHNTLMDILGRGRQLSSRSLSYWLRELNGTKAADLEVVKAGKDPSNSFRWKVVDHGGREIPKPTPELEKLEQVAKGIVARKIRNLDAKRIEKEALSEAIKSLA